MDEPVFPDLDILEGLLSPEEADEAALLALQENPQNLPVVEPGQPLRLAVLRGRKWAKNRRLRIRFMDGPEDLMEQVKEIAVEWLIYAGLEFDFDAPGPSEIRISFSNCKQYWSYIGTDALLPKYAGQPTMQLGAMRNTSCEKRRSHVLHEFGHAIGCVHEHSIPAAGIQWNQPVVEKELCQYGWTHVDVERNVYHVYGDLEISNHRSGFDEHSIMVYPIPRRWTLNGYEVVRSEDLSERDKEFIGEVYPKGKG